MNELMNTLTKCFHILSTNSNDLTWSMKYYQKFNEEDLIYRITQLEKMKPSVRLFYNIIIKKSLFFFFAEIKYFIGIISCIIFD